MVDELKAEAPAAEVTAPDTSTYGDEATTAATTSPPGDTKPTLSELEQVAMDMGWNPDPNAVDKDGFPIEWVDAKTFIRRTRDIKTSQARTIRDQTRKIDRMLKSVENLNSHYAKLSKAQQRDYDAKISALKAERRVAIAENDPDKVESLDTQIDEMRSAKQEVTIPDAPTATAAGDRALEDWVADNAAWYNVDKAMTDYAHELATKFKVTKINDDAEYREALDEITNLVKVRFAGKGKPTTTSDRRTNGNTPPADGVESSRPGPIGGNRSQKTYTRSNLSEEQRKVYDSYVNDLGLDGKQIIAEWVKIGELS